VLGGPFLSFLKTEGGIWPAVVRVCVYMENILFGSRKGSLVEGGGRGEVSAQGEKRLGEPGPVDKDVPVCVGERFRVVHGLVFGGG
jgi:hypothetical protein